MKIIDRYILKEHLIPFILSLIILLFVLLANFLIKSIDKFLGKGLDISLLIEFVFLNMAWILALAVPMAVLISTLMAFGRLSSDNEITAFKASGTNFIKLLKPALGFGIGITVLMIIFNNYFLPDMNHKARLLSADFSRTRPDIEFDVGYFINALPGNSIFLGGRKDSLFTDIIIFNKSSDVQQRTITAKEGTIKTLKDGFLLNLYSGSIHELSKEKDEYRIIDYDKYNITIPVENMTLNRNNSSVRGDREMNYQMMIDKIDFFNKKMSLVKQRINNRINKELKIDISTNDIPKNTIFETIEKFEKQSVDSLKRTNPIKLSTFQTRMKNLKRGVNTDFSLINSYTKSINTYTVELHKKFSIPVACIIFIIIGAPLGITSRRGGLGTSISMSLLFFIIYWAFLIGGEELADRGLLNAGISMWLPNIILGILGLYLCYSIAKENTIINIK
tara:strand:- start:667 stop:2010 length:1344 start_codon:yes stop_codon:yes gene_type:complete